jgi:ABC-type branched-subunit amino acid transport system ATPase component/nitrogen-specific signal transduction histidine kinase
MDDVADTGMSGLFVRNLEVDYGTQIGVKVSSLLVERGSIHAIVGNHGAGKSSLINAISGYAQSVSGQIYINGRRLDTRSTKGVLAQGVLTVYQEMQIIGALSAYENIWLNKEIKGRFGRDDHLSMDNKLKSALASIGLKIDIHRPMTHYRSNQRQLVDIARVLCFPSDLVMLDEVSTKLSPIEKDRIHALLRYLAKRGTTVIYSSHDISEVLDFASAITVLNQGEVVETASASEVDELELIRLTYSSHFMPGGIEDHRAELFYGRQFYKSALDSLSTPTVLLDSRSNVAMVNAAARELLSVEEEFAVAVKLSELLPLDARDEEKLASVIQTYSNGRVEVATEEGKRLRVYSEPLFYDESYMGTMLIMSDVEIAEGAPTTPAQTAHFTAHQISHEIINPLSITLNHLDLAARGVTEPKALDHLMSVKNEMRRVARFVHRVVMDGKSDGSRASLSEACAEVLDFLKDELLRRRISLHQEVPSGVTIPLTHDEAKHVLLNLLTNSIEAMAGGDDGEVYIKWIKEPGEADKLQIADNGPGLPEKLLSSGVDGSKGKDSRQTLHGIGLALTRSLVESAGGELRLENSPGGGACIEVVFPEQPQE